MDGQVQQMRGEIVRLVMDPATGRSKGFGFIRTDDGVEWFFHASGMDQTTRRFSELLGNERVVFDPEDGPKGPRANNVRVES